MRSLRWTALLAAALALGCMEARAPASAAAVPAATAPAAAPAAAAEGTFVPVPCGGSCAWLSGDGACQNVADRLGLPGKTFVEVKFDDPVPGTATRTAGDYAFTIDLNAARDTFSWTSTGGVDFVIAKAGTGANVYPYDPEATSGTGLVPYEGKQLSHATFCFDFEVEVHKTAVTSFTRTWSWSIAKTSPVSSLALSVGQRADVPYQVTLAPSPTDSAWSISGTVTVHNPAPFAANGITISDTLEGMPIALDCGQFDGGTLGAGETLVCTYALAPDHPITGTNTATVTSVGYVGGGSATAPVAWGEPSKVVDGCVTVSDDPHGSLGQACAPGPVVFDYTQAISYDACDASGEGFPFVNTASFVAADTGATGSASWTVISQVPCSVGCTLTQGYWKTHSARGPAPYDDTWSAIGSLQQDTPFFLSGKTWYEAFWTPVTGNAYWALAHQYMAARLNALGGAAVPPAVGDALARAEALFAGSTPEAALSSEDRDAALAAAALLEQYDSGAVGPGHCAQ